jgi:hypothetical protein
MSIAEHATSAATNPRVAPISINTNLLVWLLAINGDDEEASDQRAAVV